MPTDETQEARKKPIPFGTKVQSLGKVVAVGCIDGERYYWLVDKRGSVSMMPACSVEKAGE